jgi:hypothetical protein
MPRRPPRANKTYITEFALEIDEELGVVALGDYLDR